MNKKQVYVLCAVSAAVLILIIIGLMIAFSGNNLAANSRSQHAVETPKSKTTQKTNVSPIETKVDLDTKDAQKPLRGAASLPPKTPPVHKAIKETAEDRIHKGAIRMGCDSLSRNGRAPGRASDGANQWIMLKAYIQHMMNNVPTFKEEIRSLANSLTLHEFTDKAILEAIPRSVSVDTPNRYTLVQSKEDCIKIIKGIYAIDRDARVLLVNFGDSNTPGGDYESNSILHEQIIMRTTTAAFGINPKENAEVPTVYPLNHNKYLYSSGVRILRDLESEPGAATWDQVNMKFVEPSKALPLFDMLTIPLMTPFNIPRDCNDKGANGEYSLNHKGRSMFYRKFMLVFEVAIMHGITHIVISDSSCCQSFGPKSQKIMDVIHDCIRRIENVPTFKGQDGNEFSNSVKEVHIIE